MQPAEVSAAQAAAHPAESAHHRHSEKVKALRFCTSGSQHNEAAASLHPAGIQAGWGDLPQQAELRTADMR